MPSEIKRLKPLKEENARLKKLVADLALDKAMPRDGVTESHEACPGPVFG
jgi:putative transposase